MNTVSWFDVLPDEINDKIWKMVFNKTLSNIKKFGRLKEYFHKDHKTGLLLNCFNRHNIPFALHDNLPPDTHSWNRFNTLNDELILLINEYFGDHIIYNDNNLFIAEHTIKYLNRKIINTTDKIFNLCKPIHKEWKYIGDVRGNGVAGRYTKSMFAGSSNISYCPVIYNMPLSDLERYCRENGIDIDTNNIDVHRNRQMFLIDKCLTL